MNPHLSLLLGRILIAALFIGGAVQKLVDPSQVISNRGALHVCRWLGRP